MNKEALHRLISKYFDAETTLEEERYILKEALKLEGKDPIADEVIAVMGYARGKPNKRKKLRIFSRKWKEMGIAAAVALISIAGISYINTDDKLDNIECYAYIDGVKIENQIEIATLIQEQLSEISDAKTNMENDISNDLEEIGNALNF